MHQIHEIPYQLSILEIEVFKFCLVWLNEPGFDEKQNLEWAFIRSEFSREERKEIKLIRAVTIDACLRCFRKGVYTILITSGSQMKTFKPIIEAIKKIENLKKWIVFCKNIEYHKASENMKVLTKLPQLVAEVKNTMQLHQINV